MATLTKDAIVAAAAKAERREQTVHVPALGGDIRLIEPTSKAADDFEIESASRRERKKPVCWRSRILILTAHDDKDKPLFGPDDEPMLNELPISVLNVVLPTCQRLAGYDDTDLEKLEGN